MKNDNRELTRNEITRKSISNYFKKILKYKFLSSTRSKYAIISGKYEFNFFPEFLVIRLEKTSFSISVRYEHIEKIKTYIDGILVIFIENGAFINLTDGEGVKFKESAKAAFYED